MPDAREVGLCFTCRWARTVTNRNGSVFYRCARADTDASFPRYPQLPVLACRGYEPATPASSRTSPDPAGR